MTAFLSPPQSPRGLLEVVEWVPSLPRGHELLALATRDAGITPSDLPVRGGRALEATAVLQPVLVAVTLAIAEELVSRGISPRFVAGLSLGQVAAAAIAGHVTPEDAIAFASLRGRLMHREAARFPGAMATLTGSDPQLFDTALALGRRHGYLTVAGENAADEISLAGDPRAIAAVVAELGAQPIDALGPWHSERMRGAVDELRAFLVGRVRAPRAGLPKLVIDRDGSVVEPDADLATVLAEQVAHATRWHATMQTLAAAGVSRVITLGPGAVLRYLARKNLGRAVRIAGSASLRELEATASLPRSLPHIGETSPR